MPIEHEIRTIRTIYANDNEETNNKMLRDSLDLIYERRDQALARMDLYRRSIARYYNKGVNFRKFDIKNLVLRKVYQNRAEENAGKLGANWEGPYRVTEIPRTGVYKLEMLDDIPVLRYWNVMNLKKYNC